MDAHRIRKQSRDSRKYGVQQRYISVSPFGKQSRDSRKSPLAYVDHFETVHRWKQSRDSRKPFASVAAVPASVHVVEAIKR